MTHPVTYCRDCVFFGAEMGLEGNCHRRAPIALPERDTYGRAVTRFAETTEGGFCGEGRTK